MVAQQAEEKVVPEEGAARNLLRPTEMLDRHIAALLNRIAPMFVPNWVKPLATKPRAVRSESRRLHSRRGTGMTIASHQHTQSRDRPLRSKFIAPWYWEHKMCMLKHSSGVNPVRARFAACVPVRTTFSEPKHRICYLSTYDRSQEENAYGPLKRQSS